MIKLKLKHSLLFCELEITINNQILHLNNVLIDTGSATTLYLKVVLEIIYQR